jgi:hypothetical protein
MTHPPPIFDFLQMWQNTASDLIAARQKSLQVHRAHDIDAAGDEVEFPVRDVIREKLPSSYYVGHGHIIDYQGNTSPQCDIVVAETGASPVFFKAKNGSEFFAYESIYAIGEIRSGYYKSKKPIETWSSKVAEIKSTLHRRKTTILESITAPELAVSLAAPRQTPSVLDSIVYKNPLFSFMLFVNSGDFEAEDVSDFYKNTPVAALPNIVCLLDKCVILNTYVARNAAGELLPISMNPIPEFNAENPDTEHGWSCMTVGPDAFRAGCNLATLYLTFRTSALDYPGILSGGKSLRRQGLSRASR